MLSNTICKPTILPDYVSSIVTMPIITPPSVPVTMPIREKPRVVVIQPPKK